MTMSINISNQIDSLKEQLKNLYKLEEELHKTYESKKLDFIYYDKVDILDKMFNDIRYEINKLREINYSNKINNIRNNLLKGV